MRKDLLDSSRGQNVGHRVSIITHVNSISQPKWKRIELEICRQMTGLSSLLIT